MERVSEQEGASRDRSLEEARHPRATRLPPPDNPLSYAGAKEAATQEQ